MSQQLINRSSDLKKIRDNGFEVTIESNYLIIRNIPYVNSSTEINYGVLISELTLTGDRTTRPRNHVVFFQGDYPCHRHGGEIDQIRHSSVEKNLAEGLAVNHSFSNKPKDGYVDYYHKMTRYIDIISAPAKSLDDSVTAKTFKAIESEDEDCVFKYLDTNSSRAEINVMNDKLKNQKIGIIGLGGTGSYVLDFISKTPVEQIHLFDYDKFVQHNAFRAPGAASFEALESEIGKTEYFKEIYSRIHKNIVSHNTFINSSNVNELNGLDFVFICVDRNEIKELIIQKLIKDKTSFIDVGLGVDVVDEKLRGIIRVTSSTENKRDHVKKRISFIDREDAEYSSNIQIAELNALNASLAVIKWKKINGFYLDLEKENNSTYTIDVNMLLSNDNDN